MLFGYTLHQQAKCNIYHLRKIHSLLNYIYHEIQFIHRPLQEILELYEKQTNGVYQSWIHDLIEEKRRTGKSMQECWENQTRKHFSSRQCPKNILETLLEIGESLSCTDCKQQEKILQYLQDEVEKKLENIKKEEEEKGRLYYPISMIVGLLFVVMLFS